MQKNLGRKCDITAKGCIENSPWLSHIEQGRTKGPTSCTLHLSLHRALRFNGLKIRIHPALRRAELRAFSARASSLGHSTSVRVWGERSHRHNNSSSKQLHSRPNIFP